MNDKERLNWLEHMAKQPGGILLHAETQSTGRLGLGLACPERTLRQAIDGAMPSDAESIERRAGMGKEVKP